MSTTNKQLIGSTSWVIPGTYYENARILAHLVDFVELLVYTWDYETKELLEKEAKHLAKLTEKYGLKYTVHLPTDNVENMISAYNFLRKSELEILNYVVHPIDGISEFIKLANKDVSVENLKEKILPYEKMTFDVGHHLLGERFPMELIDKINEIHMMGVHNGKDHEKLDKNTLEDVINFLGRRRISEITLICFEIFNLDDLIDSIALFERTVLKTN
ncbi:MAG: cobamide remodeling phosphodiesterase CbiR [Fervidobacterium sp.]|uniref:cobamide remodeling phosphodiesterase CbiR n=1 Tax=Fervidobacterium sp. TaxID=1871331 RepID=UPI0040491888